MLVNQRTTTSSIFDKNELSDMAIFFFFKQKAFTMLSAESRNRDIPGRVRQMRLAMSKVMHMNTISRNICGLKHKGCERS